MNVKGQLSVEAEGRREVRSSVASVVGVLEPSVLLTTD